jgi:putative ABC transport system permease protein
MRWLKCGQAAWQVLAALPGRTLLLALPVAAAVALALATLAIDRGVTAKANEASASFGLDQVTVHGSARVIAGKFSAASTLYEADVQALQGQLRGAKHVMGTRRENEVPASFGGKNGVYKVFGVTPAWAEARNFGAERGAFLDQNDLDGSAPLCVIGQTVARELFGSQDPLGQEILINQVPFRVKGVLVFRGASPAEGDRDARIVIPLTTFTNRLYRRIALDQIVIQVADPTPENMARTAEQVRAVLRRQHRIAEGQPDDFTVRTPQSVADESLAISRNVSNLMLGLAAVFALVAAAVVGLVTHQAVRARRGEIGLRRALGAEPGDILGQVGVEGLLVSLLGGAAGLGLGLAATWGLAHGWQLPFALDAPVWAVPVLVVLLTAAAGLVAARAAARLSPTEALRPSA